MKAKQKELKKLGRLNKLNTTIAPSEKEIDILLEKMVLGTSSPQSLLNTVWLNNILHFGFRGCTEQRNLCWGDVVWRLTVKAKNVLFIHSRQGDNSPNFGPVKPRMYDNEEIQEDRNPVNVYNLYREKRPRSA